VVDGRILGESALTPRPSGPLIEIRTDILFALSDRPPQNEAAVSPENTSRASLAGMRGSTRENPAVDSERAIIQTLAISNYRSCLDASIELQPDLSVLIGPNGSGKTTILNALVLLRSMAYHQNLSDAVPGATSARLKTVFGCAGKSCSLTADIQLNTDSNNRDVIVRSRQVWYAKAFTGSAKRIAFPLWIMRHSSDGLNPYLQYFSRSGSLGTPFGFIDALPKALEQPLERIFIFLRDLKYYSASQFTNPSLCPASFQFEKTGVRSRAIGLKGHSRFLYDLYTARKSAVYQ
jgi:energy-coupling factor transporter ATP-binding protein EcfA2